MDAPEAASGTDQGPDSRPESGGPAVSVVIPAYNRAATIGPAIESVLRQTWRDFELIVVDDGSTDDTPAAARAVADPRLRVLENPRNLGAGAARNAGVRAARAAWVAFQDSDDEWLPLKLEKQMALARAAPADCVAVYCGMVTVGTAQDRDGDAAPPRPALRYLPDPAAPVVAGDLSEALLRESLISTQTLVARRDALLAIGGFDERLRSLEDWECAIRLAQRGPILCVDEPLVVQRFSANSLSRGGARRRESHARLIEANLALFRRRPDLLARQHFIVAGDHRRAGEIAAARRNLAQARRADPANLRVWAMSLYVAGLGLVPRAAKPRPPEDPEPQA